MEKCVENVKNSAQKPYLTEFWVLKTHFSRLNREVFNILHIVFNDLKIYKIFVQIAKFNFYT